MMRVVLESPFGSPDPKIVARNIRYARACLRDCLKRGEAPIASHLLYTQEGVLDDNVPEDRKLGIEAGLVWGAQANRTVVYTDLGISGGMEYGITRSHKEGRSVEMRKLPPDVLERVLRPDLDVVSLTGVCENWAESFTHFIRTGEASTAFMQHFDCCGGCQEALGREFVKKMSGLEALAQFMAEERKKKK